MRRLVAPALTLTMLLLLCAEARAGAPTERLREFFGAATRALDPRAALEPDERLGAIRTMVRDIVDFRDAAQVSLGQMWQARTPGEREEFVALFTDLLEHSLIAAIAARVHLSDGVQVRFLGESVEGATATVWTTIVARSGLELPFSYRMVERAGRWAIRDVVIDGVSVAANYRAQFSRVLRSSSYQGLVQQMRARLLDAPASSAVAAAAHDSAPSARPIVLASLAADVTPASEASAEPPRMEESSTPPSGVGSSDVQAEAVPEGRRSLELDVTLVAKSEFEPATVSKETAVGSIEGTAAGSSQGAAVGASDGTAVAIATPEDTRGPAVGIVAAPEVPQKPATLTRAAGARQATGRLYWVQVGAFKSLETAWHLAASLLVEEPRSASPSGVAVEPGTPGNGAASLARVRVGPFSDRRAAASKLREIQVRGHQPFITE